MSTVEAYFNEPVGNQLLRTKGIRVKGDGKIHELWESHASWSGKGMGLSTFIGNKLTREQAIDIINQGGGFSKIKIS